MQPLSWGERQRERKNYHSEDEMRHYMPSFKLEEYVFTVEL